MAFVPSWAQKPKRKKPEPTENSGVTLAKIFIRKSDGTLEDEEIVSCNRSQYRTYAKNRRVVTLAPIYATDPQFNRMSNRMGWDFRTPAEKAQIQAVA